MKCTNCNKSNSVLINNKNYCADCGDVLSKPNQQTTKPANTANKLNKSSKPSRRQKTVSMDGLRVVKKTNPKTDTAPQRAKSQTVRANQIHKKSRNKTDASKLQVRKRPTIKQKNHNVRAVDNSTKDISVERVGSVTIIPPRLRPGYSESVSELKLSEQITRERMDRARQYQKSFAISKFGNTIEEPRQTAQNQAQTATQQTQQNQVSTTPQNNFHKPPEDNKDQLRDYIKSQANNQDEEEQGQEQNDLSFGQKFLRAMAVSVSVLLIAGYISYLNFPNLAVRVAASKAGFEASMPSYKPSGYSFARPIEYSSEKVVISFKSNSDDRSYSITERETSWDSGSLLENYVLPQSERYLTFQEKGLTIYVYNGNQASWVNGGVWYSIDGDAPLGTEQIVNIASSL